MLENTNFKVFKVTGSSKEEALATLNDQFDTFHDVTISWKKFSSENNGASIEDFANYYLETKKGGVGKGFVITNIAAIKDKRNAPFFVEKLPNSGPRTCNKAYIIKDVETNKELGRLSTKTVTLPDGTSSKKFPTQVEAFQYAKTLIKDETGVKFKGKVAIELIKEVENGTVGYITYSPSKDSRNGEYIVFGSINYFI